MDKKQTIQTPQDNYPKYGSLISDDIKIYREYFKEMCDLIGINVIVKTPRKSKTYNNYNELISNYNPSELVGCIFTEYPDQKTLKKLGWISELQEGSSLIHLPYDLENLQVGTLVIVPSGIDGAVGRVFRIVKMSNIMVYPASITCEIVPEWENSTQRAEIEDFKQTDFNLLFDDNELDDEDKYTDSHKPEIEEEQDEE